MALNVVSSKFALLPDDDDDLNKKALRNKILGKDKEPEKVEKAPKKTNSKSKKKKQKSKSESETGKKTENNEYANWLSRDQAANDEAFAQELQAAILASKLQYNVEASEKIEIQEKSKCKKATMTLQDFNKLSLGEGVEKPLSPKKVVNENFFEDVEEATKKALNREQIKESLHQRYQHLPDQALLKQYRSVLEEKDEDIIKLTEENQKLNLELEKTKKRYKQFRELLDQVESRNKAEVISENMKLKKVQAEISEELKALREENEKLKTKLSIKVRIL